MLAGQVDHIIGLDEDGEIAQAFYKRGSRVDRQRGFREGDADRQLINSGRAPFAPYPHNHQIAQSGNGPAPNDADNADELDEHRNVPQADAGDAAAAEQASAEAQARLQEPRLQDPGGPHDLPLPASSSWILFRVFPLLVVVGTIVKTASMNTLASSSVQ